jgi:hypothetical protein
MIDEYRKNIYPYNSSLYLSYINKTSYDENLKFVNLFKVKTNSGGFIGTPSQSTSWVKTEEVSYIDNLL